MEIHGHIENGVVVPHDAILPPDGTDVTIVIGDANRPSGEMMTPDQLDRYISALARIDSLENENPGDRFSGVDHDRVLYGDGR